MVSFSSRCLVSIALLSLRVCTAESVEGRKRKDSRQFPTPTRSDPVSADASLGWAFFVRDVDLFFRGDGAGFT